MHSMVTPTWTYPPETPTLTDGDVHVWQASLAQPASQIERFWAYLARDERERAHQFRFAQDRDYFVAGRGILRAILSRYLRVSPEAITFEYNRYDKPALAGVPRIPDLQFNLSHSDGRLLLALVRGRSIGVDIERIRNDINHEEIAQRFFAPDEVARLRSLPASKRSLGFFNCWTRKEAYVKAQGDGLSRRLDTFSVTLAPEAPVALDAGDDRWQLWALDVGDDFAAGLVIEGEVNTFTFWQWPSATGVALHAGRSRLCAY